MMAMIINYEFNNYYFNLLFFYYFIKINYLKIKN